MSRKKALSINFPVERVVLSDVLPYEVPIVFSNRYFYRFLCEHSIKFHGNRIIWNNVDEVLDNLVKMVFGIQLAKNVRHVTENGTAISIVDLEKADVVHTVPFVFSTTHKQDQLRQLSLMHPKGQLLVVDFYDQFKDLMIYYTGQSEFSLRSPKRIAGCTYIDFRSQIERQDKSDALVEVDGENYENLKSFFVYERFSNVFKFYESREHLRSERDFRSLTKFDVSGCFDSIYTHSLAWAVYGKDFAKQNIKSILGTFAGKFDSLMQKLNHNETNGILIGPEVSRIFAEIILQAVDVEIAGKLLEKGYIHNEDFKIYRYVDDYFVFYNSEEVCHQIKMTLQESLKLYKLSLNKGKEETLARPIITPISIAKKRISDLFDRTLTYEISPVIRDGETLPRGDIYIGRSLLITDFKSILAISGVNYGEILNYSLSIVERKVGSLIDSYKRIEKVSNVDKNFSKSMEALLGFVFFIYAVSPKVNTTIKLCRICQRVLSFYKAEQIGLSYGALISQVIYERCRSVMDHNSDGKGAKIEVMYLLVLMRQLGRNYRVDESVLGYSFGFELLEGRYEARSDLNYFSIVTLFFYMDNKFRYSLLRSALEKHVLERFGLKRDFLIGDSEMVHLALDLVVCPFVSSETKTSILKMYGLPANNLLRIQKYSEYWFTKWGDFDFSKELDAKVSQEVY
ncbi:antiviral reverse transcriptase Drt3b [Pseudomonas fragariae (ex Marin et al. 2024)]|uniref:antiviral reverse transcriptase Drt3b n=1 Tax=Pseudomonas TaxID=286 RepID=UPI001F0F6FF7|nr:antiviral reverse transcriptase Drt3b [Pseudomonas syringae]MCH5509126.1 RNA-directed DNA polymerase [Pseudomonas syringae pv. syringae]MCH5639169.1 RNA-directed DNA polymerase [Pseudomonas syringae pv. syringae]MCH7428358.1 RNA-directed DNA polymerase [Pseudomonas syringae pv. syringae]